MQPVTTPCVEHSQNSARGYGYTSREGKSCLLHRAVYADAHNLCVHTMGGTVMHLCDNTKCINLDHLKLGTQSDNLYDMVGKGRHNPRRGEASPAAKLTEEDVQAIRQSTELQKVVAARYGIQQSQVSRIKGGTRWTSPMK